MFPRSFEQPRKVSSLDAGAAAGALLLGQGLAGLLASRPARLAFQPADGTSGASLDLPVESPHELALLSRDTAVVLASGGGLWAILDLRGTPKPRQIADDVRALYARPNGESAFATGQDGKGLALTWNRQDVGVRSFAIRGTLHACDVGDQVTYAVVDGSGGRQLHVHPGVTPELGTSVRVTLPEVVMELDRVRGSHLLSAIYKRGDERVCIVSGSGKLEAHVARLDTKPADIAVLDGFLIAVTLDGRLAFYERGALETAGETPVSALASIPLGAQGRPRVLLAGHVKGLASVWIGTTTGEIICAGAALPHLEPAAEKRAVPSRSTADVAAVEPVAVDHAALLAAREREIEELRADLQARTSERDALQADLEAARSALSAAEAELKSLAASLEERAGAHESLQAEVSRLVDELTNERERIEKIFPFGAGGLRGAELARSKLEGVLSQIRAVLWKGSGDR